MRKTYLDNIRFITVILVVIYHVIYMFNGVTTYGVIGPFHSNQIQDGFQYIVYPWFMLLLFVISGMAARFELDKKTTKEFVNGRTRKLLVPSTLGLLFFGWIMGYYNMLIGGAFETMGPVPKPVLFLIMCVSGTAQLWYIQLLWLFSILLIWIRKIEKDKLYQLGARVPFWGLLLMTAIIYGAAQVLNTPMVVVYRFGIYGAGFFLGYFVLSHEEVMDSLGKNWLLMTILAVAAGIAFVVMFQGEPYPDHVVLDTLPCNVYAWFGCLGVLAFMKKWGNFSNAFTEWMKKKSWGLYLFHYLPLAVCAWYLHTLCPGMLPVFMYVLVGVAAFGGALLIYEIVSRLPVVRWLLLGMKKGK